MFDDSVTRKARVKEVERTARQLADSVGKLLDGDGGGKSDSDCRHCGDKDAGRKLQEWKTEARKTWEQSRRAAREKGQEVDTWAREHTWQTAGIAAAAGAIVGLLLMKKKRD